MLASVFGAMIIFPEIKSSLENLQQFSFEIATSDLIFPVSGAGKIKTFYSSIGNAGMIMYV
jgi:hypothetical protein